MCIAILSTAHPHYRLIVINNRDEFLTRPTSKADWWPSPHSHVLGARDLARPAHGTWLGVTKDGRVAILTNFHETSCEKAIGVRSRGAIVNSWLTTPPTRPVPSVSRFAQDLHADPATANTGGFNIVCGTVDGPLALISNRSEDDESGTCWVASQPDQTTAISNTYLGDATWRKVALGEGFMNQAIAKSLQEDEREDCLIQRLFGVLSTDTMPSLPRQAPLESYLDAVSESVFIPVLNLGEAQQSDANQSDLERESSAPTQVDPKYFAGRYGTQKQTVLLVGHDGRVRYVERTLYDGNGSAVPDHERDRAFEFWVQQGQCSSNI